MSSNNYAATRKEELKTINSIVVLSHEVDVDGNITRASGLTVPTGAGYALGCQFVKLDASGSVKATYENVGTKAAASFVLIGSNITAKVTLTNAEIKALRATPKTLVAAPGTSRVLEFVSAVIKLKAGANVLTESTANLAVKYTDGSGVQVSTTIESTGFVDQAVNTQTYAQAKLDPIAASSGAENKALVLHNLGAGEFAGNAAADATMEVYVTYRVHDVS
jgi:hypothetical protein